MKFPRVFALLFTANKSQNEGWPEDGIQDYNEISDPELVDNSTSSKSYMLSHSTAQGPDQGRRKLSTNTPLTSARGEKYFLAVNNEWPEPNCGQMVPISGCLYQDLGEQVSQAPWP